MAASLLPAERGNKETGKPTPPRSVGRLGLKPQLEITATTWSPAAGSMLLQFWTVLPLWLVMPTAALHTIVVVGCTTQVELPRSGTSHFLPIQLLLAVGYTTTKAAISRLRMLSSLPILPQILARGSITPTAVQL